MAEPESPVPKASGRASRNSAKVSNMRSSTAPGRVSVLAYATKYASESQAEEAFSRINEGSLEPLASAKITDYLTRHGYGEEEINSFINRTQHEDGMIYLDDFVRGWHFLGKYTISGHNEEGMTLMRAPGCLAERDFVIEDCKGVTVVECNTSSQVQVDACVKCKILIGPCQGSAFVRDCEDCTFSIVARQLRVRDCKNCTFYLYTNTEPVIESSKALSFAPFNAAYAGLSSQFKMADFPPEENLWYAIFNFNEDDADSASHWKEQPASDWVAWELPEVAAGPVENPVPRDARAPVPKDSPWRGQKMGPGGAKGRIVCCCIA